VKDTRTDEDEMALDSEGFLMRQSGHGTFIAGIIRRHAPDAEVWTQGVLSSFGDGDDFDIAFGLMDGLALGVRIDVINLSLGCFGPPLPVLSDAIARAQQDHTVVVAAAGNFNSCHEFWPAALEGVVSVGATYCGKRAWFSNFGPWVTACAPGVDIVSTFFNFDGPGVPVAGYDYDRYNWWATWSGTSFASPYVAAAIAQTMFEKGVTAEEARDLLLANGTDVEDIGVLVQAVRS
jgi:subtilisin family serine protease